MEQSNIEDYDTISIGCSSLVFLVYSSGSPDEENVEDVTLHVNVYACMRPAYLHDRIEAPDRDVFKATSFHELLRPRDSKFGNTEQAASRAYKICINVSKAYVVCLDWSHLATNT